MIIGRFVQDPLPESASVWSAIEYPSGAVTTIWPLAIMASTVDIQLPALGSAQRKSQFGVRIAHTRKRSTTALKANRFRAGNYLDNAAHGDYCAVRLASFCENASGTLPPSVSIQRGAA